ncbi:MAG TPA: site-2 protease family protein [Gemmataceae bacterium]|jgi:Zn-dependent protease
MLRSFQIGKLFGIPLYLHSTLLLLPALALLLNGGSGLGSALFLLLYLIALFGCVVLHELGHALMARYYGIRTESITLYPIGGVARLERMSEKPGQEICIALAGPAVNFLIAGLLAPVALLALPMLLQSDAPLHPATHLAGLLGQLAGMLCLGNVGLMLFNLLPCFPMDGGRVLRALLTFPFGRLRATEIAAGVGLFMAFLIAASAIILPVVNNTPINPMPIVLAVFVLLAGQFELWGVRRLEARRRAARMAQAIPEAELIPVPTEPRSHPDVPFSGVAWDQRSRVWVRWINGQPVGYWG